MKVTVLSENTTPSPAFSPEFGLSLHIECERGSVLFDSGCSGNFARNARALQVDLASADYAVLSHGHFDHSDGFAEFIKVNDHAPIYARAGFRGAHCKDGGDFIGVEPALAGSNRFVEVDERAEIADGLTLLSYGADTALHPVDSGDMLVKTDEGLLPDRFDHEHYLLISEGDKRVLVTGCSHKGIANIMGWTKGEQVTHVIGGFHLMSVRPDDFPLLDDLAGELLSYPATYYTGHCTGIEQYARLKAVMKDRVSYLSTGQSVCL